MIEFFATSAVVRRLVGATAAADSARRSGPRLKVVVDVGVDKAAKVGKVIAAAKADGGSMDPVPADDVAVAQLPVPRFPPMDGQVPPPPQGFGLVNPEAVGMSQGLPVLDGRLLYRAAVANRVIGRTRLEREHRPVHAFMDIGALGPDEHAGKRVVDVHGDINLGGQGRERRAREVMVFSNEIRRYGEPVHPLVTHLYALALLLPVRDNETYEVAANNFCRLLRAWPDAVCLGRATAESLSVPVAATAGEEEYLADLIKMIDDTDDDVVEDFPADTLLAQPFRLPSLTRMHKRHQGARLLWERECVPIHLAGAVSSARAFHPVERWFPPRPSWMVDFGFLVEPPVAVTYASGPLANPHHALWTLVYTEWLCNLAVGWAFALYQDHVYHWVPDYIIEAWRKVDPGRMGRAADGTDLYKLYRSMVGAHGRFPWEHVVDDVIRRDRDTYEARAVRVLLAEGTEFGFALCHPCGDRFDWRPAPDGDVGPSGIPAGGYVGQGLLEDRRQTRGPPPAPFWALADSRVGAPGATASSTLGRRSAAGSANAVSPLWVSAGARNAAVTMFGATRVASVTGSHPVGALGEASLGEWFTMMQTLGQVLEGTEGVPLEEAYANLARAVATATSGRSCFEEFNRRLGAVVPSAPEVAPVPVVNLRAILGRRRR